MVVAETIVAFVVVGGELKTRHTVILTVCFTRYFKNGPRRGIDVL